MKPLLILNWLSFLGSLISLLVFHHTALFLCFTATCFFVGHMANGMFGPAKFRLEKWFWTGQRINLPSKNLMSKIGIGIFAGLALASAGTLHQDQYSPFLLIWEVVLWIISKMLGYATGFLIKRRLKQLKEAHHSS